MATKFFNLDTDINLGDANASDNIVASQKAIKTYIDNEVSDINTALDGKQPTISDLESIRSGASLGATAIQNTNDCVHKAGAETITGIKTFNGGTGGNNVGIISLTGMLIGAINKTAYTQYGTIRNCDGKANTGSYYINSDGSLLFRHKTGTATAEGTVNDAMLTLHPVNGLKVGWSGTSGVSTTADKDVLVDAIEYSKLNTTAKDVLGAINELKSQIAEMQTILAKCYTSSD